MARDFTELLGRPGGIARMPKIFEYLGIAQSLLTIPAEPSEPHEKKQVYEQGAAILGSLHAIPVQSALHNLGITVIPEDLPNQLRELKGLINQFGTIADNGPVSSAPLDQQ